MLSSNFSNPTPSFQQLASALRATLMSASEKRFALEQITQLRQRDGETLDMFLEQFEILLLRASAASATQEQCVVWKECLLSHLNPYSYNIAISAVSPQDNLHAVIRKLKHLAQNRQHWAAVYRDNLSDSASSASSRSPPSFRGRDRDNSSPSPSLRDRSRKRTSSSPSRDRRRFTPSPVRRKSTSRRDDTDSDDASRRQRLKPSRGASKGRILSPGAWCAKCGHHHPTADCKASPWSQDNFLVRNKLLITTHTKQQSEFGLRPAHH